MGIPPETRYTKVGDAWVAYQVIGDGPIDLVHVPMMSNVDSLWDVPPMAQFMEGLASFSRLILFDRRGTGVSDPLPIETPATWEGWIEDVGAVMDAAESSRAALLAADIGCTYGMLFAATYPERVSALMLWSPVARGPVAEDYPEGLPQGAVEAIRSTISQVWGSVALVSLTMPSLANDVDVTRRWAKYTRSTMSPGVASALVRYTAEIDARRVLPVIQVPALILSRRDFTYSPQVLHRYVADHIPGARIVEVPGRDADMSGENMTQVLEIIADFLAEIRYSAEPERVLATLLFTDIIGSTQRAADVGDKRWKELLSEHDRVARAQVDRFRGRVVNTTGDGILATFDGPGRAIRCAQSLGRALRPSGIQIRAGVHTGEIELREGGDIGGIAVHLASRVMGTAGPDEVVCSRTVKDLVAGSEFSFEDRGICSLKGIPEKWQLFIVRAS